VPIAGDPYLAFGQQAGVLPANATKQSHKAERDRLKAVVLGTNYGMGPEALAAQIGLPVIDARQLLALHRATYRTFWRWAEENVARTDLNGVIRTVYGWPMHIGPEWNPRAALNFPMQANGADIMRLAAMLATEAGIVVCAPVHDAFLIEADLDTLDDTITHMRAIMAEASRKVLNGFEIRTDAEIVRPPERYRDERGAQLWQTVLGLLGSQQHEPLHL
jgi:DNA polymerase I-like protein with 3'-5' exonuclease and polymerase domains